MKTETLELLKKINVLYIDDDVNVRKPFSRILNYFFNSVYSAENGKAAVEVYNNIPKETKIDLIISDINMPIMNGIEFVEYLRKNNDEVPVVFLTARSETNQLVRAIELNVTNYIIKPVDTDILLEKLQGIASKILLDKKLKEKEKELETIFNTTKDGIAILNLNSEYLYFNQAYLDMTGYTREELFGKSCFELSLKEDRDKSKAIFKKVIQDGHYENYEKRCVTKNGDTIYVDASLSMMPDKKRILISTRDITDLKKYSELIDKNIISIKIDINGKVTYASEALYKISKYKFNELVKKDYTILIDSKFGKNICKKINTTIIKGDIWKGEIKCITKEGGYFWLKASISPTSRKENEINGYTIIAQDISDKKIMEQLSITDGLTGIYNRRHFNEIFPKTIKSASRENHLISFILLDIDFFKQYNDTYGHQLGDSALIKVAKAIKATLNRLDDYCFRLGGEEFGIIYKSETKEKSIYFANLIKQEIENLKIPHKGNNSSQYLTVSIGLACEKARDIEYSDLFYKQADDLLYKAKESGRNQVIS